MNEQSIFTAALDHSPDDRSAFLDETCGADAALRGRVEQLLRLHGDAGSFLESPLGHLGSPLDDGVAVMPSGAVGPYKLREQIGEGGMGIVYVAEQCEPVKRKVALKIIRPGMASRDVVARFEAERQALAMMDHPNIAHVFDGGATETGQPYFVMELVQGPPLDEYCDQECLPNRERLELFVSVCRAVQHAHQRGVIHRDLKPTNILVPRIDGLAVPKVIDFGVAKAIDQKLTEQTVYTQFAQMVGTPLYMSPEQAELGVVDVDTRCDVYALGVVLYELLTGSTPFDNNALKRASFDEMRRMIREDEPPRPSARVSTLKAEALSTVSARRASDPRRLSVALRGELDWITMKALEKDRSRRYESASDLAEDVQMHLENKPVSARAPSALYCFQKFAQRNRSRLLPAVIAGSVLVIGLAFSLSAVLKERSEKEQLLYETALGLYVSHMREGVAAWEAHDYGTLNQILQETTPTEGQSDFRDWEWHFLAQQSRQPFATVPDAHVSHAAWHPTLEEIAVCVRRSGDGAAIEIWRPNRRTPLREVLALPDTPHANVRHLCWSANGSRLAIGMLDARAIVVDYESGEPILDQYLFDPTAVHSKVEAFDLSPSGKLLAAATYFGEIRTWDVDTNHLVDRLLEPKNFLQISSVAFSPDSLWLAVTQNAADLSYWDLDTEKVFKFSGGRSSAGEIAWSPDGRRLAATRNSNIAVYQPGVREVVVEFTHLFSSHTSQRSRVCWLDNDVLAAGGADHTIRIWDIASQEEIRSIRCDLSPVTVFGVNSGGDFLASISDGKLSLLRLREPLVPQPAEPSKSDSYCYAVRWSHSGQQLTSVHDDGMGRDLLRIYDLPMRATILERSIQRGSRGISPKIEWSEHDEQVCVTNSLGEMTTLTVSLPKSQGLKRVHARTDGVRAVYVANLQEGLLARTVTRDAKRRAEDEVQICNLETLDIIDTLDTEYSWAVDMKWSPDRRLLGAVYLQQRDNLNVLIYDAERRESIRRMLLDEEGPWPHLAWNSDSTKLALGTGDGKLLILDASSLEIEASFSGHRAPINELAWSPLGNRVVSCADDHTLRLWETDRGDEVAVFHLPSEADASSVDWSPDGRRLAVGTRSGEIYLLDAGPGAAGS